jgi:hypothetical protein
VSSEHRIARTLHWNEGRKRGGNAEKGGRQASILAVIIIIIIIIKILIHI